MQELAEEFGKHRAREFNMGVERRDTGVRYEDVAGIDNIKDDIEEVMKMILGDEEYRAIGARPPRVSTSRMLMHACMAMPIHISQH
jgi:cell division protease FtsH